jgi:hypothetical protein
MNTKKFDEILKSRIYKIEQILGVKAKEYSRNGDRLHNFNTASNITGKPREEVLWNGFALKHLVSVNDIVSDLNESKLPTKELVDEKIGDLINYLILLEACLIETIENEQLG